MNKSSSKKTRTKNATTSREEAALTKDEFLEVLNKAIQPVKKQMPSKGKRKTSE